MDLDENNGILACIPGETIADGSKDFPPPTSVKSGTRQTAEATLLDGTRVKLHYKVANLKRNKSTRFWWSCVRAEAV